ncbi:MAG TPA: hypothetical protein VF160_05245 [Candidatus Dormibacteraeota bacterium]
MQTVDTFRRGVSARALGGALIILAVLVAALLATAALFARPAAAPSTTAPSIAQQIHDHQVAEREDGGTTAAMVQQRHDHADGELTR